MIAGYQVVSPQSGQVGAFRPLDSPLNEYRVSTLSFEAYSFTGPPQTHNSEVSLTVGSSTTGRVGWSAFNEFDPLCPGWFFGFMSNQYCVLNLRDEVVKLEIILDGETLQVYGRIRFSGSVEETTHYPITRQQIASLTSVHVYLDFRGAGPSNAEFDDIMVTTIPLTPVAPALGQSFYVLLLALLIATGFIAVTRVTRRRASG